MAEKAKTLFKNGQFAASEKAFLELSKKQNSPTDRAVQLSNAAQCALNLGRFKCAAEHALQATKDDMYNAKAHYRLATALCSLPQSEDDKSEGQVSLRCCDIAVANARAMALIKGDPPPVQGYFFISSIPYIACRRAADLLLCLQRNGAEIVDSTKDLRSCKSVAIVAPGSRVAVNPEALNVKHVIGLDDTAIISGIAFSPNALFIKDQTMCVWNMQFAGARHAMVDVDGNLSLIKCNIVDHKENAILVSGRNSKAFIAFCNLRNCTTGVEVRQGASLHCLGCKISRMTRCGLSCYGGAHSVTIEETDVSDIGIEGLQFHGPRAPAVLEATGFRGSENLRLQQGSNSESVAQRVGDMFTLNAQRDANAPKLCVLIKNSSISRCGTTRAQNIICAGITVDQGASLKMYGTLLKENHICSVLVKGGSDLEMEYCRIEHGIRKENGLRVDVNYDGNVCVKQCVFIGKENNAIMDYFLKLSPGDHATLRVALGTRSTPIRSAENKMYPRARGAPSIDILRRKFHAKTPGKIIIPKDADSSETTDMPKYVGLMHRQLSDQHVFAEYPIGNTYGRNILSDFSVDIDKDEEVRIVLAACGDIRNIVETTIANSEKTRLIFVLNDVSIGILARNIVLLELASRLWTKDGNPSCSTSASTWLHVWGSIEVTENDRQAIDDVLKDLASGNIPPWLIDLSEPIKKAMTDCWACWKSCTKSLESVRKERDNLYSASMGSAAAGKTMWGILAAEAAGLDDMTNKLPSVLRKAELLNGKGKIVNPTLLSPSGLHYTMYESSIFRALDMRSFIGGDPSALHSGACDAFQEKGAVIAQSLHQKRVNISLVHGNLTQVCSQMKNAHVVDFSNSMDYISMPACMMTAAKCMRRPNGMAVMHSMVSAKVCDGVLHEDGIEYLHEIEDMVTRGAGVETIASSLGLEEISEGKKFESAGNLGRKVRWSFMWKPKASECNFYKIVLGLVEKWCRGPSDSLNNAGTTQLNIQKATWPSAIVGLKIMTTACEIKGEVSALVSCMVKESDCIARFVLELKAHAALLDGDETKMKKLVVASIGIDPLNGLTTTGYSQHLTLDLYLSGHEHGKVPTSRCFDVFEWSKSRGVCEVLVLREDCEILRKYSARMTAHGTGGMREGSNAVSEKTILSDYGALKFREISANEMVLIKSMMEA